MAVGTTRIEALCREKPGQDEVRQLQALRHRGDTGQDAEPAETQGARPRGGPFARALRAAVICGLVVPAPGRPWGPRARATRDPTGKEGLCAQGGRGRAWGLDDNPALAHQPSLGLASIETQSLGLDQFGHRSTFRNILKRAVCVQKRLDGSSIGGPRWWAAPYLGAGPTRKRTRRVQKVWKRGRSPRVPAFWGGS